ncbi:MAG: 1-(5-phosphoribosyl)-5-[(5-phosphoribosylamino)methylideneamino]imidazole-4-carboxamide isomerase [Omnitrophica bacterium RIFOXYB12_FULL_50_7]|nr:MAG: 1-(5-phosphoribosyl)-5-[(5-phosphoribosylamino)methylideneamino]imidazole-4-carboxamide isomerase [Omnitrophica bacterium RIFOXYB12_FULL_50_7]
MNLYPAIDIYEGKVVRLTQGDYNSCIVYSRDPTATAKIWEEEGAKWIHVVDLEGAKTGTLTSEATLTSICQGVKAKIQFGGGLRNQEDIAKVLALGVSRVVLGTKALDKTFLEKVTLEFKEKIAVGLDVRRDQVKTAGWMRDGNMTLKEALKLFDQLGVTTLIYTDIEKDGVLKGPNWEKLSMVLANTQSRVILSGGISQLSDIEKCRAIQAPNFEGVIIGKALYDKRFRLSDAVRLTT